MSMTKIHIKDRVKKIAKIVLTIIAFTVLGFVVGLVVQSPIVETISDGAFTRWRDLGSPPERITDLLGIGQYSAEDVVYVETETGNVFRCCPQEIGEWEKTEPTQYMYGQTCGSLPPKTSPPPRLVKACVEVAAFEWATDRKQFALLDDGTVWTWHQHVGLDTLLNIVCVSSLIGGVLGLLVVWRNERKKHNPISDMKTE
jgi:hypothetical protein